MKNLCVFCPTPISGPEDCTPGSVSHRARQIFMCDTCYTKLTNEQLETSGCGEPIAKCLGCGAPIYKKDNNICPVCGNKADGGECYVSEKTVSILQ